MRIALMFLCGTLLGGCSGDLGSQQPKQQAAGQSAPSQDPHPVSSPTPQPSSTPPRKELSECQLLLNQEQRLPIPRKGSHSVEEIIEMIKDRAAVAEKIQEAFDAGRLTKYQNDMLNRINMNHSSGKRYTGNFRCEENPDGASSRRTRVAGEIIAAMNGGDYSTAIAKLQALLGKEPNHPEALFLLAKARVLSFEKIKSEQPDSIVGRFPSAICDPLEKSIYMEPEGKYSKVAKELALVVQCKHALLWSDTPDAMGYMNRKSYERSVANSLRSFDWGNTPGGKSEIAVSRSSSGFDTASPTVAVQRPRYTVPPRSKKPAEETRSKASPNDSDRAVSISKEPKEYRLSAIWLRTEASAREVLNELEQGKSFQGLANSYSTGAGRDRGGDIGFFLPEDLLPELRAAADKLNPGEVSDIVHTRRGDYAILLKTEERVLRE